MAAPDEETGKSISFEKLKELDALFDEQLNGSGKPTKKAKNKSGWISFRKISLWILSLLLLLVIPFFVLIRTSVFFYSYYAINGWLALSSGVLAAFLLLVIYAGYINYRLNSSVSVHKYIRRGIMMLVLVFCGYGLLYISGLNTKSARVESYYRSLHPILRMTAATTILFYEDLVITDLQRTPEDYETMGLEVRETSLHYIQNTGYVHALDLRTKEQAEWKNKLLELSFSILGMNTLRHTGTADHLHVELPVSE